MYLINQNLFKSNEIISLFSTYLFFFIYFFIIIFKIL